MNFLTNINLNKNELQNVKIQNLASAPSNPTKGQIYFNTVDNALKIWDGTQWTAVSTDTNTTYDLTAAATTGTGALVNLVGSDSTTDTIHVDGDGTLTEVVYEDSKIKVKGKADTTKADKVTGATNGDLAGLDANGNLTDSGKKVVTSVGATGADTNLPTEKAVRSAITGAIDALDATATNDSAAKTVDTITETDGKISATFKSIQIAESQVTDLTTDLGKKADKVTNATANNFAALDANGNLKDSGKKAADFDAAGAAQTAEENAKAYTDAEIGKLDATVTNGSAAKTIDTITETDGVISATFKDIAIANTQVSGLGTASTKNAVTTIGTTGSDSNVPTEKAVRTAIGGAVGGLDATVTNTSAAKTIDTITETDGIVSATFKDIAIAESQVTDLTTHLGNKMDKDSDSVTGNIATFDTNHNAVDSGKTFTTSIGADGVDTKVPTEKAVRDAIKALPTPMQFKGTVGEGGTVTWANLPAASSANGFTYKVITDHATDPICKAGDTIVSNGTSWVVIPSGDEPTGTVTNIATGEGLTGGPITSSGTISHLTTDGYKHLPSGGTTGQFVKRGTDSGEGTWATIGTSDIDGLSTALDAKEDVSNKVTAISSSSTNTEYAGAKAVYDYAQPVDYVVTLTPDSSDPSVFTSDKTPEEILAAFEAGKRVVVFDDAQRWDEGYVDLLGIPTSTNAEFQYISDAQLLTFKIASDKSVTYDLRQSGVGVYEIPLLIDEDTERYYTIVPFQDARNAVSLRQQVYVHFNLADLNLRYELVSYTSTAMVFAFETDDKQQFLTFKNDETFSLDIHESEEKRNKTDDILTNKESSTYYPSTKAVYDYAKPVDFTVTITRTGTDPDYTYTSDKTPAEILAAQEAGKTIVLIDEFGDISAFQLVGADATSAEFYLNGGDGQTYAYGRYEIAANKSVTYTNEQYEIAQHTVAFTDSGDTITADISFRNLYPDITEYKAVYNATYDGLVYQVQDISSTRIKFVGIYDDGDEIHEIIYPASGAITHKSRMLQSYIGDVSDEATPGRYVSSVSQANGQISVTHADIVNKKTATLTTSTSAQTSATVSSIPEAANVIETYVVDANGNKVFTDVQVNSTSVVFTAGLDSVATTYTCVVLYIG